MTDIVFAWSFVSAEVASRLCKGADKLIASGNVTGGKECTVVRPMCFEFECGFEVKAGVSSTVHVPFRMQAFIEPCTFTQTSSSGANEGISRVHITVYGHDDELILVESQTENSTFVNEYSTDTEPVTIRTNITVMQRPKGIVFGVSRPLPIS